MSKLISLEIFLKTFPLFQIPSPTPFLPQSKKRKSSCKTTISYNWLYRKKKNSCWNHEVQAYTISWEYFPSFTYLSIIIKRNNYLLHSNHYSLLINIWVESLQMRFGNKKCNLKSHFPLDYLISELLRASSIFFF